VVSVCGSWASCPWHCLPPLKVQCVTCGSQRMSLPASPLCAYKHGLSWRRAWGWGWASTLSVAERGAFAGRTVRGCSVLVGARAELAVFKPLMCAVSSPASEQAPCFGFMGPPPPLSCLLRDLGRDTTLGHGLSRSACVCPGDGCSLKQPKNWREAVSCCLLVGKQVQ